MTSPVHRPDPGLCATCGLPVAIWWSPFDQAGWRAFQPMALSSGPKIGRRQQPPGLCRAAAATQAALSSYRQGYSRLLLAEGAQRLSVHTKMTWRLIGRQSGPGRRPPRAKTTRALPVEDCSGLANGIARKRHQSDLPTQPRRSPVPMPKKTLNQSGSQRIIERGDPQNSRVGQRRIALSLGRSAGIGTIGMTLRHSPRRRAGALRIGSGRCRDGFGAHQWRPWQQASRGCAPWPNPAKLSDYSDLPLARGPCRPAARTSAASGRDASFDNI